MTKQVKRGLRLLIEQTEVSAFLDGQLTDDELEDWGYTKEVMEDIWEAEKWILNKCYDDKGEKNDSAHYPR